MQHQYKHILVIRFSAMGDVALLMPALKNFSTAYPDIKVTLLTRPFYHPFFQGISNINLPQLDLKGKHKGFSGLSKLFAEINREQKVDLVLDAHDVLRSWGLSISAFFKGVKTYKIDKGREEKKAFIQHKSTKALPHTLDRYYDLFERAGFSLPHEKQFFDLNGIPVPKNTIQSNFINIGIAPFAAHRTKEWGIDKIDTFIEKANEQNQNIVFHLFGGGEREKKALEQLCAKFENVHNIAGKYPLVEELVLMKNMDAFIAMDSGNMHLAAMSRTSVFSIWGGTHPDVGFAPLYQPDENILQISRDKLPCRPCSVYGKATCSLQDTPFACMEQITPQMLIDLLEIQKILR